MENAIMDSDKQVYDGEEIAPGRSEECVRAEKFLEENRAVKPCIGCPGIVKCREAAGIVGKTDLTEAIKLAHRTGLGSLFYEEKYTADV